MPAGGVYLGFHRFGKRVVFADEIQGTAIEEEPWAADGVFFRRIDVKSAADRIELAIPADLKSMIVAQQGIDSASINGGTLTLNGVKAGARIVIAHSRNEEVDNTETAMKHLKAERKLERRWSETLQVPGTLGKTRTDSAYLVDTLNVSHDNP